MLVSGGGGVVVEEDFGDRVAGDFARLSVSSVEAGSSYYKTESK
jgi:hypothetical protein